MLMLSNMHLVLLLMLLPFGLSDQPKCYSEQDRVWNITWPATLAGKTATQMCPGGIEVEGNITRRCVANNGWELPNISQCNNTRLMMLQTQVKRLLSDVISNNTTSNFSQLLISVATETRDMIDTTIPVLPNDISVIIKILETILRIIRIGRSRELLIRRNTIMEVAENCAMILNSILNERHDDSFEAIVESPQQMSVSERLLWIIERVGILFTFTFDSAQNETQNKAFIRSHLAIDAVLPSDDDVMNESSYNFQKNMTGRNNFPAPGITIPMRAVQKQFMENGRRIPIVNILIINLESRLQTDDRQNIMSTIISSQLSDTEDAEVDLDGEKIELTIDIGMLNSTLINPYDVLFGTSQGMVTLKASLKKELHRDILIATL